ncbi:MAG: hypothetical protein QOI35_3766, partial [Cryptosporangiaceae bacterium]|nr:hypothetical protein [Cryptosporangiaceae bacterium]
MADRDQKIFTLSNAPTTESAFDGALRGYDKRQVDRYVAQREAEVAALASERDEVLSQAQLLATQVQQLQTEMLELRRKMVVERPSFRHLGARAEQILSLVEEEAEEIAQRAEREVEAKRAELENMES